MKHITALFITFLLIANLHAQDQEAIKKEAQKYYDIMESQDLVKSLDLVYPKLYDIVPRQQMEEAFKGILNTGIFNLRLEDFKIIKISNTTEKDGVKYALVTYSQKISMQLVEKMEQSVIDKMLVSFKENYGDKNVTYNAATTTFVINHPTSMFAINDPNYGSTWTFLENKAEMNELLPQIIPAEVVKALK